MKTHAYRLVFSFVLLLLFSTKMLAQPIWKKLEDSSIVGCLNDNFFSTLGTSTDRKTIYAGIDSGIIQFDGYVWRRMGDINTSNGYKRVASIVSDNASNLYIAGSFTNIAAHNYVAKWNGSSWIELGTLNANGVIAAIACDNNGNVYAAGSFTNAVGQRYVAKWNGTSWSEIGSLQANNDIKTLCVDLTGNVYAGGNFTNASGYRYVAKWNGSSWSEVGPGLLNANGNIMALTSDAVGNVYTSGGFTNASGKRYVARWDGISWEELGTGPTAFNPSSYVYVLKSDSQGYIYAAGAFTNTSGYYVAKWDGSNWSEVSGIDHLNANSTINGIAIDAGGKIYAGGFFENNTPQKYLAVFDPFLNKWDTAGTSTTAAYIGGLSSFVIGKNGHVFASGSSAFNSWRTGVKEWNGTTWSEVGTSYGIFNTTPEYFPLYIDSTLNNLYVTGTFLNTVDSTCIAKWDGTKWNLIAKTPIGNGSIDQLVIDKTGNIYSLAERQADDYRFVRKWDGTSWTALSNGSINFPIEPTLYLDHHGHLYVFGIHEFNPTAIILKWDGTGWISINNNLDVFAHPIGNITFDYNDNLYIGMIDAGQLLVWKYDGISWNSLGDPNYFTEFSTVPYPSCLTCDKFNNIYASGSSILAYDAIHKWDGNTWKPVGPSSMNWERPANNRYQLKFDNETGTLYMTSDLDYTWNYIAYYSGLTKLCPPASSTSFVSDIPGSSYQWQLNTGAGFNNISNNSVYSGAYTSNLHINNIPSSAYDYEYRCVVDGSASFTFKLKFSNTWLPNVGTAWEDPANWSCGTVPDSNTDVLFYGGHAIVNNSTSIRTLTTNGNNTNIQVNPGVNLIITH